MIAAARETIERIERLQRALQGIFPLAKATADRVAFYEGIDTNAALAGADAALSSTPAPAPSQSDEEKAKWLARSCRITGQDQNLLRTERQVAADILAAFATIRAEAERDGARARARVAKLEAALNDLRPNVDYHGHKKLDAVQCRPEDQENYRE